MSEICEKLQLNYRTIKAKRENKHFFLSAIILFFMLSGCTPVIPDEFISRQETAQRQLIDHPLTYHYEESSNRSLRKVDLDNKFYYRNEAGCGSKGSQHGDRHGSAILSIHRSKDLHIKNAHLECSTQNTIYVTNSENIFLENIAAMRGSDNALEIRDSQYVVIKDSVFSRVPANKCVETENSIVIFYNVVLTACEKGFAGERTSNSQPEVIFFIDSHIQVRNSDDAYAFVCDSRVRNNYGELIITGTSTNSSNVNCPISRQIPDGLRVAIEENDIDTIRRLLEPLVSSL